MTPIASMVKELLEKGVAHDAIVIAVEGAERALTGAVSAEFPRTSVDMQAEERRRRDRERKRMKREIPQNSADVRGNPQNSENASLSNLEKIDRKDEREAPKRNVRGHRLPDDWRPSEDDWRQAVTAIGIDRAEAELEKFRDHWKQQPGSKGVKLDWNAAWRNWIRRAAEYRPRGATHNGRRTVHDAANDLLERIQTFDEPPPSSLRSGESEDAVRMLPARRCE